MTHDPWTLHAALSCPSCHVTGKVVQCADDAWDDARDSEPLTCVDCGAQWVDIGVVGDVKDYRVQYMRMVEGRPYEPPKPPEPKKATPHPFGKMLAEAWAKDIERRCNQPASPLFDLSKLKKTSAPWPQTIADPNCPPGLAFAIGGNAKIEVDERTGAITSVEGITAIRFGEGDTE